MKNNLAKLKKILKAKNLDFFLQPNSDEFFSEYLPENQKRIEFLSGFKGSNAFALFGVEKSYFFTDSRYLIQASKEINLDEFEIIDLAKQPLISFLNEKIADKKLALDANLTSIDFAQKLKIKVEFLAENLIDAIWQNRPAALENKVFEVPINACGISRNKKIKLICEKLTASALLISTPEDVCWLLNIRSSDIEFNPFLLARAILFKDGSLDLFAKKERFENLDLEKINLINPDNFDLRIKALSKEIKEISLDFSSVNYAIFQEISAAGLKIINEKNPIEIAKAVKNSVEIAGIKHAHQIDGAALVKFLFWLEKSLNAGEVLDEILVAEKLQEFRAQNSAFLYPSFATIAGFAENGAIVHYHANKESNKKFDKNSLLLIDSGAQYFSSDFCATTDITRTLVIGTPSAEMIEDFTRVLKGHIALARAKFPKGTSGAQLDILARNFLWLAGKDYGHGTGHGVGCFLGVHEGPCSISKRSHLPLQEGMILSNEPGFYKEGQYGIRVENLVLVEKFNEEFLQFKTISLAPIDARLIDFKMLTYPEKKWLKEYHQEILEKTESYLSEEEKNWLESLYLNYPSP
jgi:Xaa-Pro aminopeptidase